MKTRIGSLAVIALVCGLLACGKEEDRAVSGSEGGPGGPVAYAAGSLEGPWFGRCINGREFRMTPPLTATLLPPPVPNEYFREQYHFQGTNAYYRIERHVGAACSGNGGLIFEGKGWYNYSRDWIIETPTAKEIVLTFQTCSPPGVFPCPNNDPRISPAMSQTIVYFFQGDMLYLGRNVPGVNATALNPDQPYWRPGATPEIPRYPHPVAF